jgi:hypothetical protein
MEDSCKEKDHKVLLVVVSGIKTGDPKTNGMEKKEKVMVKAKIIVQYPNQGAILIPDGVAY